MPQPQEMSPCRHWLGTARLPSMLQTYLRALSSQAVPVVSQRTCWRQVSCLVLPLWGPLQSMSWLGVWSQETVCIRSLGSGMYMMWVDFLICETELMAPAPLAAVGTREGKERWLGSY